jgi:hypothetical protein
MRQRFKKLYYLAVAAVAERALPWAGKSQIALLRAFNKVTKGASHNPGSGKPEV